MPERSFAHGSGGRIDRGLPGTGERNPPAEVERLQPKHRIASALAELPAAQREAFLMAEEGGMTLEEIASATGTGRETVKSRLRYAPASCAMR